MPQPVRMLSGADQVRAADLLRRAIQDRRDDWPYVHVYPPKSALDVFVLSSVLVPSAAASATIATYTVGSGKRFFLRGLIFQTSGVTTFNPGDSTFTLQRAGPPGVSDNQFQPEHGLAGLGILVGSTTFQPFPLQMARRFEPLDVVRIVGTNVNLTPSANVFYVAGLFGYEVPVTELPRK